MKMVVCCLLLSIAPLAMAEGGVDRATAYYEFSLGQQARLSGRLDEALEHYRKAIASDPRSAALRTELARLLREAGQNTQALVEAREAVKIDRDDVDAQEFLSGRRLDPETIDMAAGIAYKPARPLDNADLSYAWRKRMVRIEVARALRELAGLPTGDFEALRADRVD